MRLLPLVLLLLAAAPAPAQDVVRVRVLERSAPKRVTIEAGGGTAEVRAGPRLVARLGAGDAAELEASRRGVTVETAWMTERVPEATVVPGAGAVLRVRAGRTARAYRGTLTVAPEGRRLLLVNAVGLEDYVTSVVPAEYPFEEAEGVKAQAVLARTYALRAAARSSGRRYDVTDHTGTQVYGGVATETPIARRAARATRGEVLVHGGALAEAVYFSSSGGHTADNDAVWAGRPLPYLRGRPDPYDHAAPDHRWTSEASRAEVLRALTRRYGFRVTGFSVAERSREGRATAVQLGGARLERVGANDFRLALNQAFGSRLLRSAFFEVEEAGGRFIFRGRGYGHGVGMSQYGAREQARQGRSYRDILAFYFAGADVERLEGAPLLVEAEPAGREPAPPPRPTATRETRARVGRVGW